MSKEQTVEEMVDRVMGLIIQNSVGRTYSDKPNDYGYANGVYLNNIKAELPSILTQAQETARREEKKAIYKKWIDRFEYEINKQ